MPLTIREQNLAKAHALQSEIEPGVIGAYRNRDDEPTPDEMPCLVQFDGGHTPVSVVSGEDNKRLTLTVQGYVTTAVTEDKKTMRDALQLAVDDLYGRTVLALCSDTTLGGLSVDIVETDFADPEFILSEGDTPFAVFSVDFAIEFVTAENNPYSL